jgi:hypothetical protein
MTAAGASIPMASQSRRAATDEGVHHLAVLPGQVRSVPLQEAAAGGAENIGHLKGGPSHPFTRFLECFVWLARKSIISHGLATACRWRLDRCR